MRSVAMHSISNRYDRADPPEKAGIWKDSFSKINPFFGELYEKTWEIHRNQLWSYSRRHNRLPSFLAMRRFLYWAWSRKKDILKLRNGGSIFLGWNRRSYLLATQAPSTTSQLENGEFSKVGSFEKVLKNTNVRVSLATNVNLAQKLLNKGRFREDPLLSLKITRSLFSSTTSWAREDRSSNYFRKNSLLIFLKKYHVSPIMLDREREMRINALFFSGKHQQLKNLAGKSLFWKRIEMWTHEALGEVSYPVSRGHSQLTASRLNGWWKRELRLFRAGFFIKVLFDISEIWMIWKSLVSR